MGKIFLYFIAPDESDARRASFNKAIASGGLFEERERNYITKTGAVKWVEVSSTIVSESDSNTFWVS